MRVLTLRGYEAYPANRHTRRRMHVDHMCAMLILPACLTSQKPQATCLNPEREQQTQRPPQSQNAGGICYRGWDELQSSRELQGLAGACPGRSTRGLYWPGGFTDWLGVFFIAKLGWCKGMMGCWKPQKWSRGNKGIPPHTLLLSGISCNIDFNSVNKNIWLNHSQCHKITALINLCCLAEEAYLQGSRFKKARCQEHFFVLLGPK